MAKKREYTQRCDHCGFHWLTETWIGYAGSNIKCPRCISIKAQYPEELVSWILGVAEAQRQEHEGQYKHDYHED